MTESELDRVPLLIDRRTLETTRIADLIERYRDTVAVNKRGAASELHRLNVFLRAAWVHKPISKATPLLFSRYRDDRLKQVKPATVARELGILRSIFETARCEWDIPIVENPVAKVRKPRQPRPRDRRISESELRSILDSADHSRCTWLKPAILFALATGMRRGELISVSWPDVDLKCSTLLIRETKNGYRRSVPLTAQAMAILAGIKASGASLEGRIFPTSANALRLAWERCRKRAAINSPSISDYRFHDLRHEAISRFFEVGLSVPEVALISGHRDPRMLFGYTHLRAEDLVAKLRDMPASSSVLEDC